jgi:hypothetical protein
MKKYIVIIAIVIIAIVSIGYIYYIKTRSVIATPSPTLSTEQVKHRMKDIPLPTDTPDPDFIKQTSPTAYPLTELAIKLSFNPSSTFKQTSVSKFNSLFQR